MNTQNFVTNYIYFDQIYKLKENMSSFNDLKIIKFKFTYYFIALISLNNSI